ncbi:apolipoprotein C-II isoform X1 [Ornithorhynchus anatinus]|uniref:apolipoprotein C-II isoform X1 n=1 Tax=Ornithorhynchus anatinus TaxID=9258 RepID=UPI0004545572|nr:apolipoprotein C-II isoform X1 [Ornithorhynchus anatinus]XP_007659066.1 apolipoprotein C-II isoform X1 [Ornithorhynchus anatinus]
MGPQGISSFLLLLLLSSVVQAARLRREEPQTLLSRVQDTLVGYLGAVSTTARELYEKAKNTGLNEKISSLSPHRDAYSKSTAAMTTYTGILTDQIYHLWAGDQ